MIARSAAKNRNAGFSLIEINLAIFLVAMGMLTLFSLFPTGLKQIESASDDTQEAFFGDYVLNTLRTEAMLLTAQQWQDIGQFRNLVVADTPGGNIVRHGTSIEAVRYPDTELYMRYLLEITDAGNGIRMAKLWCRSGQYGTSDVDKFKSSANRFVTSFFYSGMP